MKFWNFLIDRKKHIGKFFKGLIGKFSNIDAEFLELRGSYEYKIIREYSNLFISYDCLV